MKFNEFQEMSKRTMPNKGVLEDIKNYSMGLAGESGEVVDLIKKYVFHGHPVDMNKLVYEIGDVMHYVAGLCTLYGITMEECATMNLIKLGKRYPEKFNSEDSIKRVDVKVLENSDIQKEW